jgi:hypothetical protein
MTLPVIDLLERAEVEKMVKQARSFEAWKKKEMMKVKVTERPCILAKGDGRTSYQVMPTKEEILERLKWVTGEEGDFDPTTMPVHLVLYFVHSRGCWGDAHRWETSAGGVQDRLEADDGSAPL